MAGDHVGVVERVHEGQALFFLQLQRMGVGVGITVARQRDLGAEGAHRIHLDLGRGGRHHDHGAAAELVGAQRHPLGVVAGRGADHALGQLLGRELHHAVVGTTQLEAAHRLLVLALEQNLVVQAPAQVAGGLQRGLDGDVVNAGREDLLQVVGGGQRGFRHGCGR